MSGFIVKWTDAFGTGWDRPAQAASGDHRGSTPTGETWRWECDACDAAIDITPVTILAEFVECPNSDGHHSFGLRSAEQYPSSSGDLPHFVVSYAQELRPVDAAHVAFWNPSRALAMCDWADDVLARHTADEAHHRSCENCLTPLSFGACLDVRAAAAAFGVETGETPRERS